MTIQTQELLTEVERLQPEMIKTLMELIRIPAISPVNGGEGEQKKAEKLEEILRTIGFDKIEHYDAEDKTAYKKIRPNLVATKHGIDTTEKLWIVTHLDIVPAGEESQWTITKPFEPIVKDGKVFGRGSEDNNHSLVASIYAVKALNNLNVKPIRTITLAFVADEEQGSQYGIQHLIKQDLFDKKDLVIVPDSGNEDGTFIEIAEKSTLWFRIRTIGVQTHASRPQKGLNAHRIGMQYALAVDKMLHQRYDNADQNFVPPASTFEPTMKEKNVEAVNIVPGEDVMYFDCRILPDCDLNQILAEVRNLAEEYESKSGARIQIEPIHTSVAPPPTDAKSRIVKLLGETIRQIRKTTPKVGGIGGGTCAAYFREQGIPAAVWSTVDETAHQPNEYTHIDNLIGDAKIYATIATKQPKITA